MMKDKFPPEKTPGDFSEYAMPHDDEAQGYVPPFGVTTVPDMTAYDQNQPRLDPYTDLMKLRSKFPFVPVMPFPASVKTIRLAANVSQDLKLADGTTVVMFWGSADFFLCRQGNADIPATAAAAAVSCSMFKPDRMMWYARGMQNVSVISATDGCIVSALCYITDEWPD